MTDIASTLTTTRTAAKDIARPLEALQCRPWFPLWKIVVYVTMTMVDAGVKSTLPTPPPPDHVTLTLYLFNRLEQIYMKLTWISLNVYQLIIKMECSSKEIIDEDKHKYRVIMQLLLFCLLLYWSTLFTNYMETVLTFSHVLIILIIIPPLLPTNNHFPPCLKGKKPLYRL